MHSKSEELLLRKYYKPIGHEAAPTTTKNKKQKSKKRGAKEGGQSSAGDDEPPKKMNKTQSELLMQVAGSRLNFYDIKRTTRQRAASMSHAAAQVGRINSGPRRGGAAST